MNNDWPTQTKDLQIARAIIEEYARSKEVENLSLFELVVNEHEKQMDFKIAPWVLALAQQYLNLYGADEGDIITRRVISRCLIQDQTIH